MMTKAREEMMDKVIRKYGFESKKTIRFCRVAESARIEVVEELFQKLMK